MLLSSPKDAHRLECGPDDDRRVYLFKTPEVYERHKFRRAVAAAGGRRHGPGALLNALSAGVREIMADSPAEARDAVLRKIEEHRALMVAQGALASTVDIDDEAQSKMFVEKARAIETSGQELFVIECQVTAAYPRFAQMQADEEVYWGIAGAEGARLFLTAWEGFDEPLQRADGVLTSASLAAIPEEDLSAIGLKIDQLIRLSGRQRKNSSSPAASRSAGETSNTSPTIQ